MKLFHLLSAIFFVIALALQLLVVKDADKGWIASFNAKNEARAEQGIEMDDEAANACYGKINEGLESELSEEELDQVAGGFAVSAIVGCAIAGVAAGVVAGCCIVKLYKIFNSRC